VGLSEIIFPHSWQTLKRNEAVFHVTCFSICINSNSDLGATVTKNAEEKELYKVEVRIPHGYYASIHDLICETNKALSEIPSYEQQ